LCGPERREPHRAGCGERSEKNTHFHYCNPRN
jgi:hypothetical protein